MLEKLFKLKERNTNVQTEVMAGITTFMTMAYILFLAPSLLSLGGMDKDAVLIATALAGGLVTIAMGVFVNYPICLAPGVGMLAFYSFTVVIGMGIPWQTALGAVFISGVVSDFASIVGYDEGWHKRNDHRQNRAQNTALLCERNP